MMAAARWNTTETENVRMGPVALFTLMAIVCLAVLAVLAVSTSNATLALAQRRADATTQLYFDEAAAQAYVAALDDARANGADPESALDAARAAALAAVDESALPEGMRLEITQTREDDAYGARFDCGNGRHLDILLSFDTDGTVRIERWRMTTVVNDEPAIGNLFGSS